MIMPLLVLLIIWPTSPYSFTWDAVPDPLGVGYQYTLCWGPLNDSNAHECAFADTNELTIYTHISSPQWAVVYTTDTFGNISGPSEPIIFEPRPLPAPSGAKVKQ